MLCRKSYIILLSKLEPKEQIYRSWIAPSLVHWVIHTCIHAYMTRQQTYNHFIPFTCMRGKDAKWRHTTKMLQLSYLFQWSKILVMHHYFMFFPNVTGQLSGWINRYGQWARPSLCAFIHEVWSVTVLFARIIGIQQHEYQSMKAPHMLNKYFSWKCLT